jgi:thioredoxin 1
MTEEDNELLRIRHRKMQELMSSKSGESKPEHQEGALNDPITVTDATFEQTTQKYPFVVIDCWAPWCGPCNMVSPVLKEIARDYAGRIVIGKVNVDENQSTAMKYGIMSIPAMLIFKNGKLVDQVVGAMPRPMLEPMITKHL